VEAAASSSHITLAAVISAVASDPIRRGLVTQVIARFNNRNILYLFTASLDSVHLGFYYTRIRG
jgi:hypothetical protein